MTHYPMLSKRQSDMKNHQTIGAMILMFIIILCAGEFFGGITIHEDILKVLYGAAVAAMLLFAIFLFAQAFSSTTTNAVTTPPANGDTDHRPSPHTKAATADAPQAISQAAVDEGSDLRSDQARRTDEPVKGAGATSSAPETPAAAPAGWTPGRRESRDDGTRTRPSGHGSQTAPPKGSNEPTGTQSGETGTKEDVGAK